MLDKKDYQRPILQVFALDEQDIVTGSITFDDGAPFDADDYGWWDGFKGGNN